MTVTVDADHETGDLSQWDSTSVDGGDMSVTAGAALAGTSYGISCLIDDTVAMYALKNVTKSAVVRYRLYFDPNSISMPNNTNIRIASWQMGGGSWDSFHNFALYYTTVDGYRIRSYGKNDAGSSVGSTYVNISDAPHYVEAHVVRATNSSSADGTIQWWLDGVDQGTTTGIDNYNYMFDYNWRLQVGALFVSSASISGTYYLDQVKANDDGTAIGPHSTLLVVADAAQSHTADNATLTAHEPAVTLTIANASQLQASDSPTLTAHIPTFTLTIANASQLHTADAPSLTQHNILVIQGSAQAQAADAPSLTQHSVLVIQGSSQLQNADSPILVQHNVLVVQAAQQAQGADSPTLTAHAPGGVTLTVQDAAHAQTADLLNLVQHHLLTIQVAQQLQSSDGVTLTQHSTLTVQSASQLHSAENVPLVQHSALIVQSAQQLHSAGALALTQHSVLSVQDALQSQLASAPALTQHSVLIVQSAAQLHAADNLTLFAHTSTELTIQNAVHSHTADSFVLAIALVIAGTTHSHFASFTSLDVRRSGMEKPRREPHDVPGSLTSAYRNSRGGGMMGGA